MFCCGCVVLLCWFTLLDSVVLFLFDSFVLMVFGLFTFGLVLIFWFTVLNYEVCCVCWFTDCAIVCFVDNWFGFCCVLRFNLFDVFMFDDFRFVVSLALICFELFALVIITLITWFMVGDWFKRLFELMFDWLVGLINYF